MNVVLAMLVILIAYGGFRLAQDYVRRSMSSFASAEQAWPALVDTAKTLLNKPIPPSIGKLVVGTVTAAGCGCFVRAMIANHYLPRFQLSRDSGHEYWDRVFKDLDSLDTETRSLFWKLQAGVLIYDSFRNPLQGWIFRHVLSEMVRPEPSYKAKMETQAAVFSVVSKRKEEFQAA